MNNDYRDYLMHRSHKYKYKKMVNGKWRYYYYYPSQKEKNYSKRLLDTTITKNIGANTAKTPYANVETTVYKGRISRAVDSVSAATSRYAAIGKKYINGLFKNTSRNEVKKTTKTYSGTTRFKNIAEATYKNAKR